MQLPTIILVLKSGHHFLGKEGDNMLNVSNGQRPGTAKIAHQIADAKLLQGLYLANNSLRIAGDFQLIPTEIVTDSSAFHVATLPELKAFRDFSSLGINGRTLLIDNFLIFKAYFKLSQISLRFLVGLGYVNATHHTKVMVVRIVIVFQHRVTPVMRRSTDVLIGRYRIY